MLEVSYGIGALGIVSFRQRYPRLRRRRWGATTFYNPVIFLSRGRDDGQPTLLTCTPSRFQAPRATGVRGMASRPKNLFCARSTSGGRAQNQSPEYSKRSQPVCKDPTSGSPVHVVAREVEVPHPFGFCRGHHRLDSRASDPSIRGGTHNERVNCPTADRSVETAAKNGARRT